jgi:hypothetical protein
MPQSFRDFVLSKVFGTASSPGILRSWSGQPDEAAQRRTRRGLELLLNFLRGQLRICDAVFSYRQFMQSRAHGYCGRGKTCTVTLSYKVSLPCHLWSVRGLYVCLCAEIVFVDVLCCQCCFACA